MELTKEFVLAVEEGVVALNSRARSLDAADIARDDTTAGKVVRVGAEADRQRADMLAGWAKRAREVVGLPPLET